MAWGLVLLCCACGQRAHFSCALKRLLSYLLSKEEIPPEVVMHLRWYLHLADEIPAQVSPRSRRRCGQAIRQSIGLMHTGHDALQVARPEDIARSCASRAEQGSKRSEINRQPFPKV